MIFLRFIIVLSAIVISLPIFFLHTPYASAETYYVDSAVSDCADYDPITFACGSGASQAYNTLADIQANVVAGSNTIYIRRGQTFSEATRFRPKSGWTIDVFGEGANPILSFTVDYAIDLRTDAPNVYWNHVNIQTTGGSAVRIYGSGDFDLNMTDVAITSSTTGIGSTATAPLTVTFNVSGATVISTGVANALVSAASTTYTGTIHSSSFKSTGSHSISFQTGLISNLTIASSSANDGTYNGVIVTTDVNGLYFTNFTANNNGTSGITIYPGAGKSQQNIVVSGGHYNGNIAHGIGVNANDTGSINTLTISGAELASNLIDGINTYGVVSNLLVEHSNIHGNGIGGDNIGRGDGVALHGTATSTVRYNRLYNNYKYQLHSIDNCNTTAYGNLIWSDTDIAAGYMVWVQDSGATLDFYNNTLVLNDDTPTTALIDVGSAVMETQNIKNNIFVGGTYVVKNDSAYSPTLNIDYNNYYGQLSGTLNGTTDGGHSVTSDPSLTDRSNDDFTLLAASPMIDMGTDLGYTTDYTGTNPIYGTPDIGAYEYQPPNSMGMDDPDITAETRVYGDGAFRYTNSTGGTTADLSVRPIAAATTDWLDLSISKWNTSGDYTKSWTESSSTLGVKSVAHTVGDLQSGKQYNVKVDGNVSSGLISGVHCTNGICLASSTGSISFIYTGGYSTKTFVIDEYIVRGSGGNSRRRFYEDNDGTPPPASGNDETYHPAADNDIGSGSTLPIPDTSSGASVLDTSSDTDSYIVSPVSLSGAFVSLVNGGNRTVFRDLPTDSWFAPYVSKLMSLNIVSGYADATGRLMGVFKPANNVTFAEIAKMAIEASKNEPIDINSTRHWASAYIAKAKELKLSLYISLLNVDAPASRGAVIQTLLEIFNIPIKNFVNPYRDLPNDHPFANAILTATKLGLINGDTSATGRSLNTVRPDDPINRAETAKIISIILP